MDGFANFLAHPDFQLGLPILIFLTDKFILWLALPYKNQSS